MYAMESNKEDAERCIELATRYLQQGNREKAEKLLLKSERLFPTVKAKELLEALRNSHSGEEAKRKRSNAAPKREEPAFRTSENMETNKEHVDAVKRIKNCKNYYEMLGVTKEATDSEIKKAYKKLALQLHPDKNKSPGAVEAFKALSNAAGILTDPAKKKQYDMFGLEDRVHAQTRGSEPAFHFARGHEADLSAEDLLNMFFGTDFPMNSSFHVRRNGRPFRQTETTTNQRPDNNAGFILQLVPVLFLIVLSMMSSYFVADPIFSLHQSSKFPVQRTTMNLKIPYYVKESFSNEYQGGLRKLEISVEEEYIIGLRHACYKEKSYRDSMIYKARTFGDSKLYHKASSQKLPSCDALGQLQQGV